MTGEPQVAWLPDGRLHLHHGPIDLIVTADGEGRESAFAAAASRFETVLAELVGELDRLTQPYDGTTFDSPVARRMAGAVAPLARDRFITPMAAVAGAVADEICARLPAHEISKATVNNGGDIAFFLTDGEVFSAAAPAGTIRLGADQPVRGLATSGWRGRSQSLGIADAVTVLAESAARADAAATLVANAVDLPGHAAIRRIPAHEVEALPQLRSRQVTTDVGPLTSAEIKAALDRGADYAEMLRAKGLIAAAILMLGSDTRVIGSAHIAPAPLAGPS